MSNIIVVQDGAVINKNAEPIKKVKLNKLINSDELCILIEKKKNEQNNS
jgi:hypothetical protein